MELSYKQLQALLLIARKRSISRAAVELSTSQPSLSRTLSKIERRLGCRLFERSGRGVEPTEIGLRVCTHAREILKSHDSISQCVKELDGQLAGRVCVTMPESVGYFLFIHLIDHFKARHPNVALRILFSRTPTIPHYLESGTADVAIVDNQGITGVNATPLMSEEFHLICPAGAGERDGEAIEMGETVGLPLVLPALEGSIRAFIDAAFAARGLRPTVHIEVDSAGALLDLVRDGHGYSILPYSMVHKSVLRGEVRALHIINDSIGRTLWTGLPANRPVSRLFRSVEQEIRAVALEYGETARWRPATGTESLPRNRRPGRRIG